MKDIQYQIFKRGDGRFYIRMASHLAGTSVDISNFDSLENAKIFLTRYKDRLKLEKEMNKEILVYSEDSDY